MNSAFPTPHEAAADAALALELLGQFFAQQIDCGAATFDQVAETIRTAAAQVARREPLLGHHLEARAAEMIGQLPGEWAAGDWREPA